MSTIRTWTLTNMLDLEPGEMVEVLESQPVLDLLERAEEWMEIPDYQRFSDFEAARSVQSDVQAFLRAHGRLGGET